MIPEQGWDTTFKELEVTGKIDFRTLTDIRLVVLKRLEAQESPRTAHPPSAATRHLGLVVYGCEQVIAPNLLSLG
jgi:hypothetical protein